jgi:hypothetical protein
MFRAYKEFGQRFPQLNPLSNPKIGWHEQLISSLSLIDTMQALKSQLISRSLDTDGANPCYRSDVIRLCRVIDQSPSGYRLACYMHASLDLGHRPSSFVRTMTSKLVQRENKFWIQVPSTKKARTVNYAYHPLSEHTCFWLRRFLHCRDMSNFHNPHTVFCFSTTPDIDNQMELLCERARYPKRYFTSSSLRKGFTDTIVCNAILDGSNFNDAVDIAKAQGRWSCTSNVIQYYISELANLSQELRDVEDHPPHDIDALTMEQKHPDLAPFLVGGNLPEPFRGYRSCANEGETISFRDACQGIWAIVRNNNNDPLLFVQLGGVRLIDRLRTLGARLNEMFELPASYDQAVEHLRTMPNGNLRSVYRARGQLMNVLIRSKVLTAEGLANNAVFDVPQMMMSYFSLHEAPLNYIIPARPKDSVNAITSTDLASLRKHALGRRHPRKIYSICYNGNEIPVTDLTVAQCELLGENINPSLEQWNAAANQL